MGRGETAKQLAAARANLALGRAKHPKGNQTAKQLASERANLVLAREALASQRLETKSYSGAASLLSIPGAVVEADGYVWYPYADYRRARLYPAGTLHSSGTSLKASTTRQVLGSHVLGAPLRHEPTTPRILGYPRRFIKRVSPNGWDRRTAWGKGRGHHMRKHVFARRPKHITLGKWRRSRKRVRPR